IVRNNLDPPQLCPGSKIDRLATHRGTVKANGLQVCDSQSSELQSLKCLSLNRVGFGGFSCGINLTIHNHHCALPNRLWRDRNADSIQQVARAITIRVGRSTLCAHQDDWLCTRNRQVKEVCSLLQ